MKNIIIAVAVISIIGVSGIVIAMNLPEEGVTLTILTRHDVAIHAAYEDAFLATEFAQENNIIDISWKTQQASFWDNVIDAGGIDILWGGGPTIFDQMQREGYLGVMDSALMLEALSRVDDEIAGTDMKRVNTDGDVVWVAAAISSFGFTVNHAFLDAHGLPTPNNWTHLASPIWGSLLPAKTIAMGNAPKTTSNTRIYEIITQGMGWDAGWVTMARMAGSARMYQGSVETQAAAENQDVGVAMSIDFYGFSTQANNPDCEYILPEGESIVNGDPIALCYNTEQQALAEGFIDWVLTAEGQSVWFTPGVNRMPVIVEAFETPVGLLQIKLKALYDQTLNNAGIDFNDTLSLAMNSAFTSYFEAVLNDAHDELTAAWAALCAAYDDGEGTITLGQFNAFAAQMGAPVTVDVDGTAETFTVEYAQEINDQMYSDDTFFYDMQTAWTAAAIVQYAQMIFDLNAL